MFRAPTWKTLNVAAMADGRDKKFAQLPPPRRAQVAVERRCEPRLFWEDCVGLGPAPNYKDERQDQKVLLAG